MVLIVLIVAAAACVVAGILSGSLLLASIALGLAVVGVMVFGLSAWSERRSLALAPSESTESDQATAASEAIPASGSDATGAASVKTSWWSTASEKAPGRASAEGESGVTTNGLRSTASVGRFSSAAMAPGQSMSVGLNDLPSQEHADQNGTVRVIPGRKRFHRSACHILEGRVHEEVTLADAEDEGFTACSACSPEQSGTSQTH